MAEENKQKLRFGILPKITLIMVLVSALPLLVIWFTQYQGANQRITNHANQYLSEVLERLTAHVDDWVEMNTRMLNYSSRLPAMKSMSAEQQTPLLVEITKEYQWSYLAFTVAMDGQNIGRSDGNPVKYYGDRSYVRQVQLGQPLGKQVLIGKTSGKPALVLAVPMHDDNHVLNGVLAIAMTIEDLSRRIVDSRIGETGFAFLVDEEGKVIAHPSAEMANTRQDLNDHPAIRAALKGLTSTTYQEDGRDMIAHMAKTREGWFLVVQQDRSETYAELAKANTQALILLLITVVMVLVISVVVSRGISAPIRRLTDISNELSRGKMDVEITDRDRGDEIGELARSVARLGNSIRLAMDRLKKARGK